MKHFLYKKGRYLPLLFCTGLACFTPNLLANNEYELEFKELEQNLIEVTGIVLDSYGEPVIGASVIEVGTSNGVITDLEGKFKLSVKTNSRLKVSYIGYETVEEKAAATMKIILKEDTETLDEVVVVGYGTMKKSDLTGAVSSVSMRDKAASLPVTSADQFLQGRVSGVNISANSGAPGDGMNIQIRGVSTISGSTAPLYVVDGFPIEGTTASTGGDMQELNLQPTMNPLASINPNDIESIEILKDASATAIYGSRATNGVVLITTKQGKEGKTQLNYNFRLDVSNVAKKYNLLNAYEYGLFENELDRTSEGYDMQGNVIPSLVEPRNSEEDLERYKIYSTDWQDLIYQTAVSQDHQIGIQGGNQSTQYNITAGYTNQEGIIINTGLERYSFRLNLQSKLSKRLTLKTSNSYSITQQDATSQSQAHSANQMVRRILTTEPTLMPGDVVYEDPNVEYVPSDNPYKMATELKDRLNQRFLIMNASLSYDLGKGFSLKESGSYNYTLGSRYTYYPIGTNAGNTYHGTAFRAENGKENIVLESLVNYNADINKKHRIDAVLGYTYEDRMNKVLSMQVGDFSNNDLLYNSIGSATNVVSKFSSVIHTKMSSFIGRVNYSFKDRYVLTATGRYDGSSLLASGNQWKFFPSLAFAWRLNQEKFMSGLKNISNAKLRISYGSTGNQNINYGSAFSIMQHTRAYVGGGVVHAYVPNTLGNSHLGWENTDTYNFGIDLGFIDNRARLSVDYYIRETKNMLMNFGLPPSSGYGSIPYNMGALQNKGMEFDLGVDVLNGPVKWTVGANIYFNRNKVKDLSGNELLGQVYLAGGGALNSAIHITKEGYPVGSFYGYVVDGVYQNADEVADAPIDTPKATPGSLKYKDISGPDGTPDGKITSDDMTIIGNAEAKFNYGITSDLSWKGLSLSMVFTGRQGGQIANLNRYFLDSFTDTSDNIRQEAWNGRWTGEGTSNFYPAVDGSNGSFYATKRFSNFLLEDASYFRLKNMTLAYQFDVKKLKWIKNMKLYFTATNLFTITDYTGYDPEVSITAGAMSPNVDYAAYPSSRTYSFGLNLTF